MGVCIFFGTILFRRYRQRHEEVKIKVRDWVEAGALTICIFAVVFLFNALVLTPKKMVEEARQKFLERVPRDSEQEEIARLRTTVKQLQDNAAEENAHEWQPLTDQQIAEWAKALAPYHIPAIKVAWGRRVRAEKLFHSLQSIGAKLPGCNVQYFEGAYTEDKEIEILTSKSNPVGDVLIRLFETLHWPVKLEHDGTDTGPEKDLVVIFIPERP